MVYQQIALTSLDETAFDCGFVFLEIETVCVKQLKCCFTHENNYTTVQLNIHVLTPLN